MDTRKNTAAQNIFIAFQILMVVAVGIPYFYVGGELPSLAWAKALILSVGTFMVLASYLIRKKIPVILWLGIILVIFFANTLIYSTNIYILSHRDNSISVIDNGWKFVRPFSCKKIYSLPRSETLELIATFYESTFQKNYVW